MMLERAARVPADDDDGDAERDPGDREERADRAPRHLAEDHDGAPADEPSDAEPLEQAPAIRRRRLGLHRLRRREADRAPHHGDPTDDRREHADDHAGRHDARVEPVRRGPGKWKYGA